MAKEILKSELDIFKNINYQASIENSTLVSYRPISAVVQDSTTIEFVIPGNSDEYIDLKDVFLWLKLSIVDENGTNFSVLQDGRYSL